MILLNGRMLCTGMLISPTAVATAGHCTDIALSNGGTVQVTFDPAPTASPTFYLAKELITAPEFTFDNPNQGTPHAPPDLGVIIFVQESDGHHSGSRSRRAAAVSHGATRLDTQYAHDFYAPYL